ncbi:aldo/keto reductase [Streptomyces griseoviridis]|uniref:aldo/keto reductase n=1 Tax=Streptomyces griseoviridis TaxID=45398 RepID=UPI00342E6041
MEYRRLGRTGLQVSAIALGSWATIGERLNDDASSALVAHAYDLGVTYFDTAETYADGRSEEVLGAALKRLRAPRESFVVSGKVFHGTHGRRPGSWGLSRKHIVEGCHATLRRTGLDHLDILLCHRFDPDVPLEETVRAMSDLVTRGDILYWGTSEWTVTQVAEARDIARARGHAPPQVEQLLYNVLERDKVEREFAPAAEDLGIGLTIWSPLAYGLLSGRYDHGVPADGRLARAGYEWLSASAFGTDPREETHRRLAAFSRLAAEHTVSPSRLALAWVLRHPAVASAICGASRPEHLSDNAGALDVVPLLDRTLLARIDALLGMPEPPPPRTEDKETTR